MQNYSFKKVSSKIINQIKQKYQDNCIDSPAPIYEAKYQLLDCTISVYKNKTVLFQGKSASNNAKYFFKMNNDCKTKTNPKKLQTPQTQLIIGSDEVGVGDIFGPLVTSACLIPNREAILKLKRLNLVDSKQLSTEKILALAPAIKKIIPSATIIIYNEKYNDLYSKYQNSHVLKAISHYEVINKLIQQNKNYNDYLVIIDQFCSWKNLQKYWQKAKYPILPAPVILETKAENKYLAVAAAAIISRAKFLKVCDELRFKYHYNFGLGANNDVKRQAQFIKQHADPKVIKALIKLHFKIDNL